MKDQVIAILNKTAGTNRAILTLPTGAGKTRTAVDGIIDFLNKTDEKKKILWIVSKTLLRGSGCQWCTTRLARTPC